MGYGSRTSGPTFNVPKLSGINGFVTRAVACANCNALTVGDGFNVTDDRESVDNGLIGFLADDGDQ